MKLKRMVLFSVVLAMMFLTVPFAFGSPDRSDSRCVGKVTGGGQCVAGGNDEIPSASFGFNAMRFSRETYPKGELNYVDHITGMHVHVHELTYLEVWEDLPGNKPWPLRKAIFGGPCTIDGVEGYFACVYVEDNGEPGTSDKFEIEIDMGSQGYYIGGSDTISILVGNIQIHKPPA